MGSPPRYAENEVVGGKFKIIREIGAGGMGAVYEVQHLITQHLRALKVLRVEGTKEQEASIRLLREASAAGRIGNPHIVETYDAGTLPNGDAYVIMELLEGESLSALLKRRGRLTVPEVANLIGQACGGLQAAHDAGIIHRDVKPANFFVVQRNGKPFLKIVDFGVSKFDTSATDETELTRDGAMIGTPGYMSPEQVRAVPEIDGRVDIYGLGCIMYVALTGERPFGKGSVTEIALRIDRGAYVPIEMLRPDLPPEVMAIVAKAMATERVDRYKTARDLGEALAPFLSDENVDELLARLGVEGTAVNITIDRSALGRSSQGSSEISRKSNNSNVRIDNPAASISAPPLSITPPTHFHEAEAEKPRTGETAVASEVVVEPARPRRKQQTAMVFLVAVGAGALLLAAAIWPKGAPADTRAAATAVRPSDPLPPAVIPLPSAKIADPPVLVAVPVTPPLASAPAVSSGTHGTAVAASARPTTSGTQPPKPLNGSVRPGVTIKDPTLLDRSNPY